MGKKEKAKKKSQSVASNDLFKRVEEIYGKLFSIYNWLMVVCMCRNQIWNSQCSVFNCLYVVLCSKETAKDSWPEFEVLYELLSKLESLQEPQLR